MRNQTLLVALLGSALLPPAKCAGANSGTVILTGDSRSVSSEAARTFIHLVGEAEPKVVVIAGSAQAKGISDRSSVSLNGNVSPVEKCSSPANRSEMTPSCAEALRHLKPFRLKRFTLLVADDPMIGSDQGAVAALREASGVWFTGAEPMGFVHAFRDAPAGQELMALLERGGVIGADSGAVSAMGSLVLAQGDVNDHPEDDVQGLNLLDNAVIDREINKEAPSGRLSAVVARHPGTVGISLGESGVVVVHAGVMRVASVDAILISDNEKHYGRTYYRLSPEEHLNLETHTAKYIPQTGREKFDQTLGLLFRPGTVLSLGAAAGIAQANNAPKERGQGSEGYGHRFGVFAGLLATRQSLLFVTSSLDHEDLRRFRSQKTGFWPRTGDAVKFAFESRRDNGSAGFAYARFVSDFGTGVLARQLYPSQSGTGSLSNNQPRGSLLQFGFGTIGADVVGNVFFEFSPDIRAKLHLDRIRRALHLPERNALR